MALCIPPDLILTVLEGVTAIIHYCLLDPTSQYHQVRAPWVVINCSFHFSVNVYNLCTDLYIYNDSKCSAE